MDAPTQALAEAQAAQDRELLLLLSARPKAEVDALRVSLGAAVIQRPNRAQRRAMEKAARRSPRRAGS